MKRPPSYVIKHTHGYLTEIDGWDIWWRDEIGLDLFANISGGDNNEYVRWFSEDSQPAHFISGCPDSVIAFMKTYRDMMT